MRIIGGLVVLLITCGLVRAASSSIAEAARNHDPVTVRALLAGKADPNAALEDGATALLWAAHWDDIQLADLLIGTGASPNAADDLGITPLILACINGSGAMVRKLLAAGANPNSATSTGETPLMTCSRSGSTAGVRALLDLGADVNAKEKLRDQTALMWAVSQTHPDVVRLLLEHQADLHARTRVTGQLVVRDVEGARFVCPPDSTEEDRRKATYKVEAIAGSKDVPTVTCARADVAPKGGSTALLFAARSGDVESARLLIAAGANANDVAPDANSALVLAAYSGHGKLAELLLERDSNPNAAGAGYTALHVAVLTGDAGLVKALLAHGANPNLRLTKGTPVWRDNVELHLREELAGATPFFLAAKFVEVEMMRALAAAGADTRLGLQNGTTPLMAAAGVGWRVASYTRRDTHTPAAAAPPPDDDAALAAVKLALELGGDVRAVNSAGDTALHGAANAGYAPIVQLLVERGADIDAKNSHGMTPLSLVDVNAESTKGRHDVKSAELMLRRFGAR
jgi:ankyrin repeat protein